MQKGHVLASRYRLLSLQSAGGMGDVWRAEHVALRSPVAVKLLGSGFVGDPEAIARFVREAQAAAWLRSPHIVQVLDCGSDQGVPFIVMELLEGETLAERIERDKRLSPIETALIITHVARALGKAHEAGVVHRDLKPENVFLVRNEEEMVAKVLDFGVAKIMERDGAPLTSSGTLLGTPAYMSPEQAFGGQVDHRTDIWALGVIAFECLLGRRVFCSESRNQTILDICTRPLPVPSAMGRVPAGFDEWFAHAVNREPARRFRSAREAAARLRETCGMIDAGPYIHAASPDFSSDPDINTPATLSLDGLIKIEAPTGSDSGPVSDVLARTSGARRSGSVPIFSATSSEAPGAPGSSASRSGIEYSSKPQRSKPILVEPPSSRRTSTAGRWGPAAAVVTGLVLLVLAVILALLRN